MNTGNVVVGDADVLVALFFEGDKLHLKSNLIIHKLNAAGKTVIFPNTAIIEAITTLQRKLSRPEIADYINKEYIKGKFEVECVNDQVMVKASQIFNPYKSKQNTFFDAIVAATAQYLGTDIIFSFDSWYPKLGFKLASD